MKAMGSSVVCDRQEGEVEGEEGGDFAPDYEQGSELEGRDGWTEVESQDEVDEGMTGCHDSHMSDLGR
jgi:hypothetical protein